MEENEAFIMQDLKKNKNYKVCNINFYLFMLLQ